MEDERRESNEPQGEGDAMDVSEVQGPPAGGEEFELTPEGDVAASLSSALQQLREDADQLAAMDTDDAKLDAAERVAERAAELDEQIGSIARSDEG